MTDSRHHASTTTEPPAGEKNVATVRILDAALNRAGEGLRVVEDYLRMALDDGHLAKRAKQLRHDLAEASKSLPAEQRTASRDTLGDVGTRNSTASEQQRLSLIEVATASFRRTAEALRTIEEYGKLLDTTLAKRCEQLRYQLYTLEKATTLATAANQRLADARLYVLVEGAESAEQFAQQVETLVTAGVHVIQLRDKRLDDRTLLARCEQLVALTRPAGVISIVNDRPDLAAIAKADGVHLGQDDLTVAAARRILGPEPLVGVSTHHLAQAQQAVLDGANYLGAGPTFASGTKQFTEYAGLAYLQQVAAEVSLPTYAIGGITAENLPQVLATGITRIAVAGAVTGAPNPTHAVEQLLAQLPHSSAEMPASEV
ncbi:thiamine phosphate synthase [Aeoliella mucimassa]|nr:thiamine phosphate synthase [Aeoliella mucimassa]